MKKIVKISLLIAAVIMIVLAAASCAKPTVESISLKATEEFQTVYLLGQELDLSGATLDVKTDKGAEEVSLGADGVSISGYSKNTLGEQTVSIEYGGAVTTFTVTVVEGVAVNGAVTDYLVGDSFDQSMGAAKITKPDGTTLSVDFSSDAVTVSGFDSSQPGEGLALRVTYTDGTNVSEGTLYVNIYAVDSVEFYSPNKVTYGSHYEGEPDASGGRFVLKGNEGKLKREVPITSDMISGLDTSAASADRPNVTQTLTVTYDGQAYNYEVQIDYTDISLFLDTSDVFNEIKWNGSDVPAIDGEAGELAIKLMNAYIDMPSSDRELLDADTVFNVARAAMVAGVDLWWENVQLFDGVFTFSGGERVLELESYEKVKASLELFDDKTSPIYTIAPLLAELAELYGDRVIYERAPSDGDEGSCIRFDSYNIMDSSDLMVMKAMLQHTLDVYDLVKDVPADWRESGLVSHYSDLGNAALMILNESYAFEYTDIYYLVSEWREGNDLLDMLYAYLYEANGRDYMSMLALRGLSSNAANIYVNIFAALTEINKLGDSESDYTDGTGLIYCYYTVKDTAALMESDEDGWENYLYNSVAVNYIFGISDDSVSMTFADMAEYVRAAVLDVTLGYAEEPIYESILDSYVDIIEKAQNTEGYYDSADFRGDMKALFDSFIALTPMEQCNLISIFNTYYRYGIPQLSFDDKDTFAEYTSLFNKLINSFMKDELSDAGDEAYDNLIIAIEVYANRFNYPEWESDFTARMDKVQADSALLSADDAEFFNTYLKTALDKYSAIRGEIGKTASLGEWADEFEELYQALRDVQLADSYISDSIAKEKNYNSNYLLASYERALAISGKILKNAPADVVYAFCHLPLFEASAEDGVFTSCDYALSLYRDTYMSILLYVGSEGGVVSIYDVYRERGLDKFLDSYYGMISVYFAYISTENKQDVKMPIFDKDEVLAVLDAYSLLDSDIKALFSVLEGGVDIFGSARTLFISEAFTAEAGKAAEKLFELEASIYKYEITGSGVELGTMKTRLSELQTMVAGLSGADADSFAPLMGIYTEYVEKCNSLTGA